MIGGDFELLIASLDAIISLYELDKTHYAGLKKLIYSKLIEIINVFSFETEHIYKYEKYIIKSASCIYELCTYQKLSDDVLDKIIKWPNCFRNRKSMKKLIMKTIFLSISEHQTLNDNHIEFIIRESEKNLSTNHNIQILLNLINVQRLSFNVIRNNFIKFTINIDSDGTQLSESLIVNQRIPEDLLEDNIDMFSIDKIVFNQALSSKFIYKFSNIINFKLLGEACLLEDEILIYFKSKLCMKKILKYQNLSSNVLNCFINSKDTLCEIVKHIETMSYRQSLDSQFILKNIDLWFENDSAVEELVIYQKLSIEVLNYLADNNYLSNLAWIYLSQNQKFDSYIFSKYKKKLLVCSNSMNNVKNITRARYIKLIPNMIDLESIIYSYL